MELSKICDYTSKRIDTSTLCINNYVSTENMMPNKAGIVPASKVPNEKVVEYQPGDILLSNIRPYFKKIWYADKNGGCSSDVLCIRAKEGTDSTFLYYLLSQDSFFDYVMSGAKGSKMPRGDKSQIMKWEVEVPDLNEQKRIGIILKTIDDKIALNNRINHNLEEQAQALFKSWFVDFEPFKNGDFKETELGRIPIGWNVIPFKSFITASKEKVMVGELPEYSVTNNGIIPRDLKFNKKLSQSTAKNKVLRHNDLVFGMSRDILNWGIMEDEVGSVSSAYNVYIINKDLIMPQYLRLYMIAKLPYFNDLIGTAAREGQGLDKSALNQKKVYIPSSDICLKFFNIYDRIIEMQKEVSLESQQLANYRDYILPHLLSGTLISNSFNV